MPRFIHVFVALTAALLAIVSCERGEPKSPPETLAAAAADSECIVEVPAMLPVPRPGDVVELSSPFTSIGRLPDAPPDSRLYSTDSGPGVASDNMEMRLLRTRNSRAAIDGASVSATVAAFMCDAEFSLKTLREATSSSAGLSLVATRQVVYSPETYVPTSHDAQATTSLKGKYYVQSVWKQATCHISFDLSDLSTEDMSSMELSFGLNVPFVSLGAGCSQKATSKLEKAELHANAFARGGILGKTVGIIGFKDGKISSEAFHQIEFSPTYQAAAPLKMKLVCIGKPGNQRPEADLLAHLRRLGAAKQLLDVLSQVPAYRLNAKLNKNCTESIGTLTGAIERVLHEVSAGLSPGFAQLDIACQAADALRSVLDASSPTIDDCGLIDSFGAAEAYYNDKNNGPRLIRFGGTGNGGPLLWPLSLLGYEHSKQVNDLAAPLATAALDLNGTLWGQAPDGGILVALGGWRREQNKGKLSEMLYVVPPGLKIGKYQVKDTNSYEAVLAGAQEQGLIAINPVAGNSAGVEVDQSINASWESALKRLHGACAVTPIDDGSNQGKQYQIVAYGGLAFRTDKTHSYEKNKENYFALFCRDVEVLASGYVFTLNIVNQKTCSVGSIISLPSVGPRYGLALEPVRIKEATAYVMMGGRAGMPDGSSATSMTLIPYLHKQGQQWVWGTIAAHGAELPTQRWLAVTGSDMNKTMVMLGGSRNRGLVVQKTKREVDRVSDGTNASSGTLDGREGCVAPPGQDPGSDTIFEIDTRVAPDLGFGLIDDAWLLELDDSGAEPTAEWKRVPLPSGQAARFCVRAHFQAAKDGVPGSFIIAGGGPRIRTGPLETDPMKRPQSMFSVLRIPLPE